MFKWLSEEDIRNVYKCWYRVIVVLLSHQKIIFQNATSNISFSRRTETIFFFYFTVITFAVYERTQNWPSQIEPNQLLSQIRAIAYSVENN